MSDSYKTILTPSPEILYKDKGSKFYATAFPLKNGDDMSAIIELLKKRHIKAGHHCYAWKLGIDENNYRVNDDGEPRNSAGAPIYGQIQSYGVSDIAVVVSRIFGGTKLGVSGLIHAYKESASLALNEATIVLRTITKIIELKFGYPQMSQVMRFVDENKFEIINQNLEASCVMQIAVPASKADHFTNLLNSWHPIKAESLD